MLTFIFKTGLTTKMDGHKKAGKTKKNRANKKYSYQEDNPRWEYNSDDVLWFGG